MHVLLVDNSKPDKSFYTPRLQCLLEEMSTSVRVCKTLEETVSALANRWDAVVLSGSSLNMTESMRAACVSKALMTMLRCVETPFLGVCFGMQLMAVAYGGDVDRLPEPRDGEMHVSATTTSGIAGMAHFSHQDVVTRVPPEFQVDALSDGIISQMSSPRLARYGVQFHPEASTGVARDVVKQFLNIAARSKIDIIGNRIGSSEYARICLLLGSARAQHVAEFFRLPRAAIEAIWSEFRKRYRIPAILL